MVIISNEIECQMQSKNHIEYIYIICCAFIVALIIIWIRSVQHPKWNSRVLILRLFFFFSSQISFDTKWKKLIIPDWGTRIFSLIDSLHFLIVFLFIYFLCDSNAEAAGKTNVMVVSDLRRALPQFMVVAVKNLILLGKNDGCGGNQLSNMWIHFCFFFLVFRLTNRLGFYIGLSDNFNSGTAKRNRSSIHFNQWRNIMD